MILFQVYYDNDEAKKKSINLMLYPSAFFMKLHETSWQLFSSYYVMSLRNLLRNRSDLTGDLDCRS